MKYVIRQHGCILNNPVSNSNAGKKSLLFFLGLLISLVQLQGQTIDSLNVPEEDPVFMIVEYMPVFGDCGDLDQQIDDRKLRACTDSNLTSFIENNLQLPKKGEPGNVFVSFIIGKDGSVRGAELVRGIDGCEPCNQEALRLISALPDWSPGTQRGIPVSVYYRLALNFTF